MPKVSFGIDKAKKRRDKLRYILKRYTQCEIAAKLGISQSAVSMKLKKCLKYAKICERAEKMKISTGERVSAMMDVESADKKFNMRLDDWLNANDFNFAHDYCGIQNNINRSEFPATDFGYFLPRFAGTY